MAVQKRDNVLLLIAAFKLVKAATLIAIGAGALSLVHGDVAKTIEHVVAQLRIDPHNRHIHGLLESVGGFDAHKLRLVGAGTFIYAAVFLVEGVALLTRRPWAEWLTIAVTGSFIPLEIVETVRHFTPLRLGGIVMNIAIVVYLVLNVLAKKRAENGRGGGSPDASANASPGASPTDELHPVRVGDA